MAYQILGFAQSNTGGGVYQQINAVSDQNFVQQQTGVWRFTEQYDMLAFAGLGATITGMSFLEATWQGINLPTIYPPILGIVPPTNPQVNDYRRNPVSLPMNENFGVQYQGGAGGAENEYGVVWISPTGSSRAIPKSPSQYGSMGRVKMQFTAALTITALAWSPDVAIVLTNSPYKSGTYLVLGCQLIAVKTVAYRINFPNAPMYNGRKLSPGNLTENVYGNIPLVYGPDWLGPMGYFDTNQFFQIAVLGSTTATVATYTGYLDCLYMGPSMIGQGGLPAIM